MNISFSKYHGAGNDFILIDNRISNIKLSTDNIAFLCNRHLGIGADGLMFLNESKDYDFEMIYYNSDGKESTMCGNGGRCITAFAHHLGIIKNKTNFIAVDGEHEAEIISDDTDVVQIKLKMVDVNSVKFYNDDYIINTGSPHYIKFVEDIMNVDVYNIGQEIRYDKEISGDGVNVNFVEVKDDYLFVRTYERGVEDETLACGTGVTASAIAYSLNKNINKISIKTIGGQLMVSFAKDDFSYNNIYLEGPAKFVFKGEIKLS